MKDGERISRRSDGSIKTIIHYDKGVKDGEALLYYDDGQTIMLRMQYTQGKRSGTSVKYYKDGSVYAETSYRNDVMHGTRKTFYRDGSVRSVANYGYGLPAIGLAEYYKNGKVKELPAITSFRSHKKLTLDVDGNCKDVRFFIGDLVHGQFLNEKDPDLIPVKKSAAGHTIDLDVFTPSYLKLQDVICVCKSGMGNPVILTKRAISD